ncbi:hypothetical protein FHY19_002723 [Xanthomonas arboricola]|nr:hypothetical protein [Xanthomonas sp. 4461]
MGAAVINQLSLYPPRHSMRVQAGLGMCNESQCMHAGKGSNDEGSDGHFRVLMRMLADGRVHGCCAWGKHYGAQGL